jgi:peptidoglycan/LPS O-acetylase OafA/YrhL
MTDWVYLYAPGIVGWLSQDARMAVQVFLVIAGFLAARSLAPSGVLVDDHPIWLVWQRYVRVCFPYFVSVLLAILCTKIAREWMTHDSMPGPADLWQVIAHGLLVHSLLNVDSLSAGVWYVAIDMQLFMVLLCILYVATKWHFSATLIQGLVAAGVVLSLFFFNRDSDWDIWAVYFFGAYGLGALTYWFSHNATQMGRWLPMLLLTASVLLALAIEFRTRIALALAISLLLFWVCAGGWRFTWTNNRVVTFLSNISYSVFLINFPVALVINAWFTQFAPANVWFQSLGVLVAWAACNAAGALFYALVERKTNRLAKLHWRQGISIKSA